VHELDPYFTEDKMSRPTYIVTIQSHTTQQVYYLSKEILLYLIGHDNIQKKVIFSGYIQGHFFIFLIHNQKGCDAITSYQKN